jgi:uncharacterized membrane protein
MKLWTKIDWLILVFIFLVFAFSFVMIPALPDRVPTHWNIQGEVNGWGSKYINLFLAPGIALFFYILMSFLPAFDPLRKNYDSFAKPYQYFKIFLAFFFIYIQAFLVYSSMQFTPPRVNLVFALPLSLLFCFVGWILPQLKRNFFIGIRTPWTLVSDDNWKKTHDFGGKVFIAAGLVSLAAAFLSSVASFVVLISSIFVAATVTVVYSYLVFRKEKK